MEWINSFHPNSVFFDIGANIGLYSIYAAKSVNAEVYAFEPSVFNLPILAKNIYLNSLSESIVILPIPLSDKPAGISTLSLSNDTFGGALHTFQESYTWDSSPIDTTTNYNLPGMSLDTFHDLFLSKKLDISKSMLTVSNILFCQGLLICYYRSKVFRLKLMTTLLNKLQPVQSYSQISICTNF